LARRRFCGGGPSARQAVFDLTGRNATFNGECDARGLIYPEFDDSKEAVGLVVRKKRQASAGGLARICRKLGMKRPPRGTIALRSLSRRLLDDYSIGNAVLVEPKIAGVLN